AGVIGIAGRTPLTADTCPLVPDDLWNGPGFVVGPRATTAFLATHRPEANPTHGEVSPDLEDPYLLWSLVLDGEERPRSDLLRRALAATTSWSDPLRELVRRSDPDSVDAFVFYRPVDLTGWPAGRVAVVGDAAHPIPPTAGIGASIAIADVGDLAAALRSSGDPTAAVQAMQQPMLRRAAHAQRSSSRVLAARSALRREALRRPALGAVLPTLDRAIRLQTSLRH
ncbi:FAD-dependent monooxygenase, partial [Williamsia sp.]|uniref:FAD-dependent oxidoreductase n=1 Tax=Williamsia sp. TaxID=1872085 RepID=UPI001A3183BC